MGRLLELGIGNGDRWEEWFGKGAEVELGDGHAYVYEQGRRRRWRVSDSGKTWDGIYKDLELQARAGRISWHTIMCVHEKFEEEDQPNLGVAVDVITGDWGNTTPIQNVYWSVRTNGMKTRGHGGGCYGRREVIEADLKVLGALALVDIDLPERIDVEATAAGVAQAFLEGKFRVPDFVRAKEQRKAGIVEQLADRLRHPKSLIRR